MNAKPSIKVPELFSVEAEQELIGAVLCDNTRFWRVSDQISPEDFYDPLHQRIWGTIADMLAKNRLASASTVMAAMTGDEGLIDVGPYYLANLSNAASVIGIVKDYARVIVDFARRRKIVMAASNAIDLAYYESRVKPEDIADQAGESIYDAAHRDAPGRGPEAMIDVVRRAAEMAEASRQNPHKAKLSFGLSSVDKALGGLFPRDLHVLAAAPNIGKSGLSAQIGLSAALGGYTTLIFSKEMAAEEFATRYLAAETRIPSNRLAEGRISEVESQAIADATQAFCELPLLIDGASNLTVAQIRARCQATRRRRNALSLVIIDHLRFIAPADRRSDERDQIQQITRDLKSLAKDMELAVLLVAHLNRDFWKRQSHRPIVSDLYGSSAIEQNADHIWFLHREEYYLEREQPPEHDIKAHTEWLARVERAKGMAEIFGAKRRGGPLGSAQLRFDAPFVRFTEIEQSSTTEEMWF
jgi:replicative DNA helicase